MKSCFLIFKILVVICIFTAVWFLAGPKYYGISKGIGSSLGVAGYCFFSLSLLLSSRWKKLEDWIGGLDQIYHVHRKLGILGFCLILIHPWVEAIKWLPNHLNKFFLFIFPVHGRLSMNLGSLAFWLMILILGVTFLKLLPYDKWKILHKFMSAVFILASLHILLSEKRWGSSFAQSLLFIPMGIGFFGILYKQLFFPLFVKRFLFEVIALKPINENVIEIALASRKDVIKFIPGQYGFFSFDDPNLTKESHPFTLVGPNEDSTVTILVKARGDYTQNLYRFLKKGDLAWLEGPYGRFDYKKAGNWQIWIAGGIGIVPFLAWIRTLDTDRKIDFYYCVHRKKDAIFYEKFQQLSETHPNFRCFLHCTEDKNRLDMQKIIAATGPIDNYQILMCGPIKLTHYFAREFQNLGIKKECIFFEDFEFF